MLFEMERAKDLGYFAAPSSMLSWLPCEIGTLLPAVGLVRIPPKPNPSGSYREPAMIDKRGSRSPIRTYDEDMAYSTSRKEMRRSRAIPLGK